MWASTNTTDSSTPSLRVSGDQFSGGRLATVKPLIKGDHVSTFKCVSSGLAFIFAEDTKARCEVGNEDVAGAAPTGDAPTTSE